MMVLSEKKDFPSYDYDWVTIDTFPNETEDAV